MSKIVALAILDHPNKDEILSKLIQGVSCDDIHEWLDAKYGALQHSTSLVISSVGLSDFKENFLEYTVRIRDDLEKTAKLRDKDRNPAEEVLTTLQNNPEYNEKLVEHLEKEINIKEKMISLFEMAEQRITQVYQQIQQNPTSFKGDRVLLDWFDKIGMHLQRYHEIVLAVPETTVNNNVTINIIDEQATKIQNAIRATLSHMDNDASMQLIDIFTKEHENLKEGNGEKLLPIEDRYIEAQLVEEKFKK